MPTVSQSSKGHQPPPLFAIIFYPPKQSTPPLPSQFRLLPSYISLMTGAQYQQHVNHIKSLRTSGALIQGGPYGDLRHSVPVVKASSLAAAKQLAASDPAVKAGLLKAAVVPWNIVFGVHPGI